MVTVATHDIIIRKSRRLVGHKNQQISRFRRIRGRFIASLIFAKLLKLWIKSSQIERIIQILKSRKSLARWLMSDNSEASASHGDTGAQGNKRKFSPDEDEHLQQLVNQYGFKEWKTIAQNMLGRTARQCRERWRYYLHPSLKSQPWTPEEDDLLIQKYVQLGPHWAKIAKHFKHRTDISLKNRFRKIQRLSKKNQTEITYENNIPSLKTSRDIIELPQPISKMKSDQAS